MLVDRARPERLGELVRSLLPAHPEVEVYTSAVDLARAEKGALAILITDPQQATWLNLERPIFANRELRVILFSDAETSAVLARSAPDFFHWISHRLECPEGVSLPAVRGIQAALKTRAPGLSWTGGDFEAAFHEALPGRPLHVVSAAIPYEQMVAASTAGSRGWVAWTGVDGPFRLRRVRWATAEAGRRGRVALIAPGAPVPGFVPVDGVLLGVREARKRLQDAGAAHPGRLAALLDLEVEAVTLAAALLGAGVEGARLEAAGRAAPDPGVALGGMAKAAGVLIPPGIQGRMGDGGKAETDAVEALLRGGTAGGEVWVDAAEGAIAAGDYEPAVVWAKRGLALAGESVKTLQVAGRALERHGDYDEAEGLLLRAIDAAEKGGGRGEIYASALADRARILELRGRHLEAERLLRKAVAVEKKTVGAGHPNYGIALHDLAMVLRDRARHEEAEDLLKQATSIVGKALGKEHISYAMALGALGTVLMERGKYASAETQLRRSVDIMARRQGKESLSYAEGMHWLGRTLLEQRKYADAEGVLRTALSIKARILGKNHVFYAASLSELARCQIAAGAYGSAEQLLQEALSITERTIGTATPDYAVTLHELAGVFLNRSEYVQGEQALRRVVAIEQESLGQDHPALCPTLYNLAIALSAQGRFSEGEAFAHRSLEIAEKNWGPRHPDTARSLALLAQFQVVRRSPEALITATRALDALTRTLGAADPATRKAAELLEQIKRSVA